MKRRIQIAKYVAADYVSANLAWLLFNLFRFYVGGASREFLSLSAFLGDRVLLEGQLLFPLLWMFIYYLSGYYNQPFLKSRLLEFFTTLFSSLLGSVIVFFVALLNDIAYLDIGDYKLLLVLFFLQFVCTYLPRLMITQIATDRIHTRMWGFDTLIVGAGEKAFALYNELNGMKQSLGFRIVGFVPVRGNVHVPEEWVAGSMEELNRIVAERHIEEIIVALDATNRRELHQVINKLYIYNLPIKLLAEDFELITSRVRLSNIYGTPFIDVSICSLSECEKNLKRTLDVGVSLIALFTLLPVYLVLALKIKADSAGPVFYCQERLGYHRKPFVMYKFRTMVKDAETGGPALSKVNDDRITSFGKFMRKYRLDELPQFWNVLKGDMSLVGPRPERPYFIEKIVRAAPYYSLLHQVRPGITSWGMVKYGYAGNVKEMVQRLKYDIIYLENMSLLVDLKIIIYTVKTVVTGKGI